MDLPAKHSPGVGASHPTATTDQEITLSATTDIVPAETYDGAEGLEDFNPEDASVPRLIFAHKEGVLKDSLTGESFDEVTGVLLGLIKQRILWQPEVEDDAQPLCKSYDFKFGVPDLDTFPFKAAAGINKADIDAETPRIDCGACPLKEWDSHPTRTSPWCSEQWVLPIIVQTDDGGSKPMIMTVQRSGLTPAKSYISSFATSKQPLFTALTKISLKKMSRGTVDYVVPIFSKVGATGPEMQEELAARYRAIRTYVTTPRVNKEGDVEAGVASSAASPAPDPIADEEDIPF